MSYSNLTNTQSPEMCMFFNMVFKSHKSSKYTGELKQIFRETILYNEHKTYRDKVGKLQSQKLKISKEIDRLSGPSGLSDAQYAQYKKLFEIYKTINQSILKLQLKYL